MPQTAPAQRTGTLQGLRDEKRKSESHRKYQMILILFLLEKSVKTRYQYDEQYNGNKKAHVILKPYRHL